MAVIGQAAKRPPLGSWAAACRGLAVNSLQKQPDSEESTDNAPTSRRYHTAVADRL